MRVSLTLSQYLARHFLIAVSVTFGGVLVIAALIDLVELFRRTAQKVNVPFRIVLEMAILKTPFMAEQLLPYGILIGAMIALIRLTRSQELIVARAAGVSVWQFLLPLLASGVMIGLLWIGVLNPVAASMNARYDALEIRWIEGKASMFSISESDLWLRQVDAGDAEINHRIIKEYILRASRLTQADMTLHDVTIFTFDDQHTFIGRVDTPRAKLFKGYWQFAEPVISVPGLVPESRADFTLKTDLSIAHIQDSFADPSTISFWQLSGFIHTLENAGFSALRHRVYWHSVLATPFTLAAMVLIAAVFSLRLHRRGRIGLMIVGGIVTGFFINFMTSLFHAFGISGGLPVLLAAWAPPALALIIATALLLHLEDG